MQLQKSRIKRLPREVGSLNITGTQGCCAKSSSITSLRAGVASGENDGRSRQEVRQNPEGPPVAL
jgi:hypothetical protein